MSAYKYSRQREAIYEALRTTREHPSAEVIYEKLRPEFPNLSLATVYRNLAFFKNEGRVKSVATVNGIERFDADMRMHSHFVCIRCGRVTDMNEDVFPLEALERVSETMGVEARTASIYGLCEKCKDMA